MFTEVSPQRSRTTSFDYGTGLLEFKRRTSQTHQATAGSAASPRTELDQPTVLLLTKEKPNTSGTECSDLLHYCLQKANCQVDKAESLQSFIAQIDENYYNAIFVDYDSYSQVLGSALSKVLFELLDDVYPKKRRLAKVVNYYSKILPDFKYIGPKSTLCISQSMHTIIQACRKAAYSDEELK